MNHLTHSLSAWICILCWPRRGASGKKSPCSCNSHCLLFFWLLHGNVLPICCTYSIGVIPSCSELLLYPFPLIRAVQIFVLEFSKDWLGRPGGGICRWWYGQPTSDTARRCRSPLWPGVWELLPTSVFQLPIASWNWWLTSWCGGVCILWWGPKRHMAAFKNSVILGFWHV